MYKFGLDQARVVVVYICTKFLNFLEVSEKFVVRMCKIARKYTPDDTIREPQIGIFRIEALYWTRDNKYYESECKKIGAERII